MPVSANRYLNKQILMAPMMINMIPPESWGT